MKPFDFIITFAKNYIQIYDPGYFNFMYSLRALVVIGLSVIVSYILFSEYGRAAIIWAAIMALQVFFLDSMMSARVSKRIYLFCFVMLSVIVVGLFSNLAQNSLATDSIQTTHIQNLQSHALQNQTSLQPQQSQETTQSHIVKIFKNGQILHILYLVVSLTILSFFVGMSRVYDIELYKMLIPVLVNALLACMYVESGIILPLLPQIGCALIGLLFATASILLLDNSSSYGKYAQVYFPMLLTNIINMVKNIDKPEFDAYKQSSLTMIDNMKQALYTKGGSSKNTLIIKNIKRAIFYVCKIEDICIAISILRTYFLRHRVKPLQNEIIYNLMQLRLIFKGKTPKLKNQEYKKLLEDSKKGDFCREDSKSEGQHQKQDYKKEDSQYDVVLINSIKILYNKIFAFWRVGRKAEIVLVEKPKKTLKDLISAFNLKNVAYRFSFKYSVAIGLAVFISSVLNLKKGIWIALSMLAVMRPSIGEIGNISKSYIIAAIIGILIGVLVSSISGEMIFYLLFVFVIFLMIYFKPVSYSLWSGCLMCAFVMMYSLIYPDFIIYVLDRLIDISVGIILAIIVFWLIWPTYARDGFLPLLKAQNGRLEKILDSITKPETGYYEMQNIESELYQDQNNLSAIVQNSKSEIKSKQSAIAHYGDDVINILNAMIERAGELVQFCFHLDSDKSVDKNELYIHDIKVLHTRMQMINKLVSNESHYFKMQNEERFLSTESKHFTWIITDFFNLQNKLYETLNRNIVH